ncbi:MULTISPECIES: hypothetical protein [Alteromonadaceae]|uniref:hypothetical protein n=1 Tax=Alteromonadaceae TaxID=72275 RepID=UPI001C0A5C0B|nr:hypothetical protein [Aliiglaciecola lipolytica]MBU2876521.1 hypothetical protein [Aliiglaciecola lipolytica]
MLDLLANQKAIVENKAELYKVSKDIKRHALDKAQDQSKQWISSPRGLLASFVAGSIYELQSSSDSNSTRTIISLLLRAI